MLCMYLLLLLCVYIYLFLSISIIIYIYWYPNFIAKAAKLPENLLERFMRKVSEVCWKGSLFGRCFGNPMFSRCCGGKVWELGIVYTVYWDVILLSFLYNYNIIHINTCVYLYILYRIYIYNTWRFRDVWLGGVFLLWCKLFSHEVKPFGYMELAIAMKISP